ncbi:MAG: Xaa-Pro dipeptidase, partial [Bacteroidota bacterium]
MRKLLLLLLVLPFVSPAQTKALVGGTLIDGYGGKPLANSVIIIEGERIKAIGTVGNIEIPKSTEIISTEGMSVMPGLWDMHVHLM